MLASLASAAALAPRCVWRERRSHTAALRPAPTCSALTLRRSPYCGLPPMFLLSLALAAARLGHWPWVDEWCRKSAGFQFE